MNERNGVQRAHRRSLKARFFFVVIPMMMTAVVVISWIKKHPERYAGEVGSKQLQFDLVTVLFGSVATMVVVAAVLWIVQKLMHRA